MNYPFLSVVKQDFQAVDDLIRANLNSEVPMVEEIAAYLIEAGGKTPSASTRAALRQSLWIPGKRSRKTGRGDRIPAHRDVIA